MLLKIIIVVSTQPSITWYLKICPKFQVLSSHFSEVDELFDEHWAKKKWINQKMTILHADNCFKVARYDESYTFLFHSLVHTYSLGQGKSQWVGRQGLNSSKVLKLSAAPRPICRNFLALARAYIAELSEFFFSWILSVAISRWQGFNCQNGHSTSNVLYPGVGSGARTQPQSKCASQGSANNGHCFSLNCWKYWNNSDISRFFWRWTSILKASSHQSQEEGSYSKP